MIRLFVGVSLPKAQRNALASLRRPMAGTRWVAPENLHLTLRFAGEVDEACARDIDEALLDLREACFDVEIRSVGSFGTRARARTLWAGTAADDALARLAARIDRALGAIEGVDPRAARFHSHITLARLKFAPADQVASFLSGEVGLALPPFTVEAFTLYSSKLTPEGARYRAEADYPLGAPMAK